jgi:molecular chaperone GrpE (heat shock protein)
MLENFALSFVLWVGITLFLLAWARNLYQSETPSPIADEDVDPGQTQALEELQQECDRLRLELEQLSAQKAQDLKDMTFEELETLLTNYPTACKLADHKPDLPAKNLIALFTPLENLINSWGYETIGQVWEEVAYDPQFHQADDEGIPEGETVYIRFIGYRDGDRILAPAKVSQTLPPGV